MYEIFSLAFLHRRCAKFPHLIVSATRKKKDIKNAVVSVGICAEKFNLVSNDHALTQKCNFCV